MISTVKILNRQCRRLSGTTPPFCASFSMTALWSAIFSSALPSVPTCTFSSLASSFRAARLRVEIKQLQQVNYRGLVIATTTLGCRHLAEHCANIHVLGGRLGGSGGRRR